MFGQLFQMCCGNVKSKKEKLYRVFNSNGEINESDSTDESTNLPEHVDNALLNRNLQTGILRFRYQNKTAQFIVYSSVEAKTFCILMKLDPIK